MEWVRRRPFARSWVSHRPDAGQILLDDVDIAGKPPFQIAQMGIGYMPDDRRIFPDLTLFENLELARRLSKKGKVSWTFEKVYNLFPVFVDLKERKGNPAERRGTEDAGDRTSLDEES